MLSPVAGGLEQREAPAREPGPFSVAVRVQMLAPAQIPSVQGQGVPPVLLLPGFPPQGLFADIGEDAIPHPRLDLATNPVLELSDAGSGDIELGGSLL